MSETQAPTAPKKLNAIQLIEQELAGFIRQREQAIANVHAVEGAIQGAQCLLAVLKAEVEKAEAEAKKLGAGIEAEGEKVIGIVEGAARLVETRVEAAVDALAGEK